MLTPSKSGSECQRIVQASRLKWRTQICDTTGLLTVLLTGQPSMINIHWILITNLAGTSNTSRLTTVIANLLSLLLTVYFFTQQSSATSRSDTSKRAVNIVKPIHNHIEQDRVGTNHHSTDGRLMEAAQDITVVNLAPTCVAEATATSTANVNNPVADHKHAKHLPLQGKRSYPVILLLKMYRNASHFA